MNSLCAALLNMVFTIQYLATHSYLTAGHVPTILYASNRKTLLIAANKFHLSS